MSTLLELCRLYVAAGVNIKFCMWSLYLIISHVWTDDANKHKRIVRAVGYGDV